jgi:hypothetical protein
MTGFVRVKSCEAYKGKIFVERVLDSNDFQYVKESFNRGKIFYLNDKAPVAKVKFEEDTCNLSIPPYMKYSRIYKDLITLLEKKPTNKEIYRKPLNLTQKPIKRVYRESVRPSTQKPKDKKYKPISISMDTSAGVGGEREQKRAYVPETKDVSSDEKIKSLLSEPCGYPVGELTNVLYELELSGITPSIKTKRGKNKISVYWGDEKIQEFVPVLDTGREFYINRWGAFPLDFFKEINNLSKPKPPNLYDHYMKREKMQQKFKQEKRDEFRKEALNLMNKGIRKNIRNPLVQHNEKEDKLRGSIRDSYKNHEDRSTKIMRSIRILENLYAT